MLPDISFMNNLTIWIFQWLENVIIKICAERYELLSWRHDRSNRFWRKATAEIPLLSNLSFLHSPFEEKRKRCGRFKCWRLLFLSAILFGQQGCHIINTRPRTWEPLFCTPLPRHEMTTFMHNCHMKNTHPKEAGKWDLIPLLFFFFFF